MASWLKQRGKNRPFPQQHRRLSSASFWLEGLALPLAAIILEALPVSAWLQLGAAWLANDAAQVLLPTWGIIAFLLAAFGISRWLAAHPSLTRWPTVLISLGWVLSLLLAWYFRFYTPVGALWQSAWLVTLLADLQAGSGQFAGVLGMVLLLTYLWWRGLHLGRASIEFDEVSLRFKLGAAAVVLTLLFLGTIPPTVRSSLEVQLGFTLPVFLFAGLAALSLARLAEIQRTRRQRSDPQANPTRSWVVALLVLSAGLILLTLVIEQLFSYRTWLALIKALQPVWDGIATVLGWIALGLAYLLYWIFNPLVDWLRALLSSNQQSTPSRPIGATPPTLPQNGNGNGLPAEWEAIGQWVLIGVGVIVLLLILWRAFRLFASWRSADTEEEERENLGATRVLGEQLRNLLASLAARFQRRQPGEAPIEAQETGSTVRALYRRVLRQAQAQGQGRQAPETPDEFAQRLRPLLLEEPAKPVPSEENLSVQPTPPNKWPELPADPQQELAALTTAYEQTRYGDQEPSPEELQTLTEGLDHLLGRLAAYQGGISKPES
jgi:hypothetical protein